MTPMTRRRFLTQGATSVGALAGAVALGGSLLTTRMAFAAPSTGADGRFVFIILRGALDGLSAVPPYGDSAYAALRGPLALPVPGGAGGALPLDNLFALHPSLAFLHESFSARELTVLHAVATPYRERSHFDGQDVLESGVVRPHASESGWLNRALAAQDSAPRRLGVALGTNVPLVMRGPVEVASWSPSHLASLSEDTLQRVTDLYASDSLLSQRLADALASDQIAAEDQPPSDEKMTPASGRDNRTQAGAPKPAGAARFVETARAAASFLGRDDGPRVAVLETSGWDTHANEGGSQGQLAQRLAALDAGLREFRAALGPVWRNTAILLATEFGRTAATNGTRGTDHGTGSAAFLIGGAVEGGRVHCDWPSLGSSALYEGRDLKPTLDLRAAIKGVLHEQLKVSDRALDTAVFPDSAGIRRIEGLIRA
jgi:uncharacterized protein (DUF1501 family)